MNKPTIYITHIETGAKYKVVDVNKETKRIILLDMEKNAEFEADVNDFGGSAYIFEKVQEEQPRFHFGPHPIYDKPNEPEVSDQRESNSSPALVDEQSKIGLTESHSGAPTQQEDAVVEQATNVAQYDTPLTVTNRREALALSEAYKAELKPVFDRMKAVKAAVECGHKGEAKKIAYIIQWSEKYLND